ncbi:MAG: hypothetical protein O7C67_11160 [Gammaproteobacteria bacterium]|nr:hypothetical protein [Gammaproteobacteria bacterium]
MKKLMLFACLCLASSFALAGHHVNGTWKLNVMLGGQQAGTATFELMEGDGGALTGTYTGAVGSAAVTGSVNGAEVEFSFDSQAAGIVSYRGTVSGNKMEGSCDYGVAGEGTFEGEKS